MTFFTSMVLAASVSIGQIMAGPSFEHFAHQADKACPSRQLRMITPGDLSWEQETFEDQLPSASRQRLASVNLSARQCAGRDGLSCPTTETLDAMAKVNMLAKFVRFACRHPQP